jgi:hypothetical protein
VRPIKDTNALPFNRDDSGLAEFTKRRGCGLSIDSELLGNLLVHQVAYDVQSDETFLAALTPISGNIGVVKSFYETTAAATRSNAVLAQAKIDHDTPH